MAGNSLVRRAVALIAKDGRPTITAVCESVTVKDRAAGWRLQEGT